MYVASTSWPLSRFSSGWNVGWTLYPLGPTTRRSAESSVLMFTPGKSSEYSTVSDWLACGSVIRTGQDTAEMSGGMASIATDRNPIGCSDVTLPRVSETRPPLTMMLYGP